MTRKKMILIGAGVLVVLVGIGAAVVWFSPRKNEAPVDITANAMPTATPVPAAVLTWNDPAGFTFQYEEGVVINKHDENQTDYAQVEFSHPQHPGGLTVWARDTKYVDTPAWVRGEKQFAGANSLDTLLGKQPAKKILLAGEPAQLVTGTIYDQLLFYVEAKLSDREYWTRVHDRLVDSFAFIPLEGETSVADPATGYDDSGAVDEEETLE